MEAKYSEGDTVRIVNYGRRRWERDKKGEVSWTEIGPRLIGMEGTVMDVTIGFQVYYGIRFPNWYEKGFTEGQMQLINK